MGSLSHSVVLMVLVSNIAISNLNLRYNSKANAGGVDQHSKDLHLPLIFSGIDVAPNSFLGGSPAMLLP